MGNILKILDQLIDRMPANTARMIRLGAIGAWFILATIVIFKTWSYGSESVPSSGQDLSFVRLREKIEREKNLKNPPELNIAERSKVTIPDTGELINENSTIPFNINRKKSSDVVGESNKPIEPKTPDRTRKGPAFIGEDNRTPGLFPHKKYLPDKDRGVGGVRQKKIPGEKSNVLPLPSRKKYKYPGSKQQQESKDKSNTKQPKTTIKKNKTPSKVIPLTRPSRTSKSSQPKRKKSIYPRIKRKDPEILPGR